MEKRLQTILAHAGISSRRGSVLLIEDGKVSVDGKVVREKGRRLDPEQHEITVNGNPIKREKKFYFLFNKPTGVLSTSFDTHDRKTVMHYFENIEARLYSVGRLDKGTSGLIIVTNDGDLAHRLAHPSFEIQKEYIAKISSKINPGEIRQLENGVVLDGSKTGKCQIKVLERFNNETILRLQLHEGKKRQIRRMFKSIDKKVVELERVKYAGLSLGSLRPGVYRKLKETEISALYDLTGLNL